MRLQRKRAGIPDELGHQPKWRLALEMLDELAEWGLCPPVIATDAGYGNNAHFRDALTEWGLSWIVQVESDLSAHPADAVPELREYLGAGPRGKPRYRDAPMSLCQHALTAGRENAQEVTWRAGSRDQLTSRFLAIRIRPAGRKHTARLTEDGSLPEQWLIADWPQEADEPEGAPPACGGKYWLSNLPADTAPPELVRLGKIRWRIERDYRELKTGLGLDHFEGRSFTG